MKILKILFLCAFCIIALISVDAFTPNPYIIEEESGTITVRIQEPGRSYLTDILHITLAIDLCLIWVVVYTQFLTKPQKTPYNSL